MFIQNETVVSHFLMSHFELEDIGCCSLPPEFTLFTGPFDTVEVNNARESPRVLHEYLAADKAVLLTGPYAYIDAVYRYCQRFERALVSSETFDHIEHRGRRKAAFAEARRRKLHRLLVAARGEDLLYVEDAPDTRGLQAWLETPTGKDVFLIPVRRLQRILTDMHRARRGVPIDVLEDRITILPHVYVPADQSVPAMFVDYRHLLTGKQILDMGTGTGVLALLAAKLGAASVVATDVNPNAVKNARTNVRRLSFEQKIEVREPADLFEAVQGETYEVILFNPPWIQGEPGTRYNVALYDANYRVLDGFLQAVPRHLTPDGVILLQYSNISQCKGEESITHLEWAIEANGLWIATSRRIKRLSRVLGAHANVFLYEIRRRRFE